MPNLLFFFFCKLLWLHLHVCDINYFTARTYLGLRRICVLFRFTFSHLLISIKPFFIIIQWNLYLNSFSKNTCSYASITHFKDMPLPEVKLQSFVVISEYCQIKLNIKLKGVSQCQKECSV